MQYIIERLEEKLAICENDHKEMLAVPREELPDSIQEGDVLVHQNGQWKKDPDASKARRDRMKQKMMDLFE